LKWTEYGLGITMLLEMPNSNDFLAINTLRALALDAICKAKEGHPGAPLGMAPMAYVLFTTALRFNPKNPNWANRDRFVLSAGHASMLQYGVLHLTGYDVTLQDLKQFRQYGSRTAGHPEFGHTAGVEVTTGPLGQGFANAVGLALGGSHLAARYNKPGHEVIDYTVYGICSDGDLQEGISHEAASFAGHLGLGNLVMLYDDNNIQLDGPTEWAFSEDITKRFEAYGWHVQSIKDGDTDLTGLENAIAIAKANSRPSLIRVQTTIGYGLPKAGTADVHGKAPSTSDVESAKTKLEYPSMEAFWVSPEGAKPWQEAGIRGTKLENDWNTQFAAYKAAFPELAAELEGILNGTPVNVPPEVYPKYDPYGKPVRTRNASGDSINALMGVVPSLIGGSADLSGSNMTTFKGSRHISKGDFAGRNIHYGVREHAMAAIANGLARTGLRPFVSTFFTFSDYMKNSIRLSSLMGLPVIYVFTHDSIGVGTDGPTHQPIEHLAGLRAIPFLNVIRPSDANETSVAWKLALERTDGPTALILSRQDLPVLMPNWEGTTKGGYIVQDSSGTPDVILIATGSEVGLAMDASAKLLEQNVSARVVALPCWDIFETQPLAYRESVLPSHIRARVGIEAAASFGWERYVGLDGKTVTLDRFGASAPDSEVFEKLGFNVDNVVKTALEVIKK
jgi:transketolase